MMKRTLLGLVALPVLLLAAPLATAQSLEDIQLRKDTEESLLGFGFVGMMEYATNLMKERPEQAMSFYAAPQLKIDKTMRLQLNMWASAEMNPRMENYGWRLDDWSVEFAHLKIFKEPVSGITLSGRVRYYIPISWASRQADSYGQLRGFLKLSTSVWKFYFSVEGNAQKYFSKYTTWNTDETQGSDAWFHRGGYDDYVDNNANYGFGQTYTVTFTPFDGLDLSLIWGMSQIRTYSGDHDLADAYGSSYLQDPRWATWNHAYRFVGDVTFGLAALPGVSTSPTWKDSLINNVYLSVGYAASASQLQNGGRTWSLNPFQKKYGQVYLDLALIY